MKKAVLILIFLFNAAAYSQWQQTLNGISIWSLGRDLSGNVYAGSLTATSKLYKTSNQGINWVEITTGNGQTIFSIAVDSAGNIFAANFSAGLLKSTNGGANFVTMPASIFGGSSLNAVACGKNGEVYVGTNGAGFHRSTDYGSTFNPTGLTGLQVITITVDNFNSAIVYAGVTSTSAGPNGFYRSTDYGATFSANLNPNYNIYGIIQFDPQTLISISTTTGGPVFKSINGGFNWTTVNTGYVARGITKVNFTNAFYIAGNGGVYYSTNSGQNFVNDGITASATPILNSGSYMYAGLSGSSNGGVWVRQIPLGVINTGEIASEFSLSQNYPNPFNPMTNIKYQILNSGFVVLTIFDAAGREITKLVNQNLSAGTYKVQWDALNYPSGVYFYRIAIHSDRPNSGEFSYIRKMVLLK